MPALPRAGWLALGAILAALLTGGGNLDVGLPVALVVAAGVGALGLVAACLARGKAPAAAFLLGFGAIALRAGLALAIAPADPALPLPDGNGPWWAKVADVSSPAGDQQRAFLRLTTAGAGEEAASWLVYAWLPRHPAVAPGDLLTVSGALEPPPPDSPGFAGFLAGRGASGTLKAESAEARGRSGGAMAAVERLRRGVDEAIGRAIPEPEAGLASGILVGLRERVGREVADDFTTTGLTHVVAISGWNIALVAGIATGLLRAAGLPRRGRSLLVLVAIVAYTVVAGAEASVVRAAVMGGVVLLAREGGRPAGAAAALGVACAGLLLVDPGMVGDIGLQLSLAATAGLLALGGAAEAAVRRRVPRRTPGWLPETLGVSLAAQLATLPLDPAALRAALGHLSAGEPADGAVRAAGHAGSGPGCRRGAAGRDPGRGPRGRCREPGGVAAPGGHGARREPDGRGALRQPRAARGTVSGGCRGCPRRPAGGPAAGTHGWHPGWPGRSGR